MYEIERRFLVKKFSAKYPFPPNLSSSNFRQGYFELPTADSYFRVRIINNQEAILCIKNGKGMKRSETESRTETLNFGERAFELCTYHLEKVRYWDGRWEIDFFSKPLDGIVIAEIELKSVDEKFEMPKYIEEAVEVTDSLTSHHLARLASELEGSGMSALPLVFSCAAPIMPRIVLTGGPCSGKSTIMDVMKSIDGLHRVPEVASIVITQLGIKPRRDFNQKFQKLIHKTQKLFEETSAQYASIEGKRGILFDRGTVDGAAYFDGGVIEFEKSLRTKIYLEYFRYDLVICLDVPPEDVYELRSINNPARLENYKQARKLGDKIKKAWQNHHNFVFIGNDGGWDEKVRKVKEAIDEVLR